ncbi:helix-turn-helix domain-containing protein [Lacihabitans sp. LS3-19]|uniref:helix-turn-helix domain-containing protein n=1 Tax=Lacihabitans sp. LS3-19 TaxID=2487335 RepID=UPI0020CE260B|nr:helix-turn-helix domain-containing protein [Lacihabitans sp. LS3-19]MCP9770229.1 helix-turn-helix domain-containing protein [Lacihabitans sp. LS3-19]
MNTQENPILHKLELFIDNNLDQPGITSDYICKQVGVSRAHLHRILKQKTDLPVSLFIRKRRLEKAKNLLHNTEMRISEIADAVGISSPQNFSKYFTQEFESSPTDFRKNILPNSEKISIAVLPFQNMSRDSSQEYFSDGITEEIINVLSQVPALKVLGRSSTFVFKGKDLDIREIGKVLNVDYLLEGSVRKSENKLRISANLVSVKDGFQVWSEKFDRVEADIFDIQDEISIAILEGIKVKLFGKEKENAFKRYTNDHQAYQLYLQGRFYFNKFGGKEDFLKSISYFEAAIEIEPNYAPAYSGIASCYLNMWFYRYLKPEKCLKEIRLASDKSIQLDKEIPESHLALARMQLLCEWNFEEAEKSLKMALKLGGNLAEYHSLYALIYGLRGNHKAAKKHTQNALELDPLSLFNNFYASYLHWIFGDFEGAIAQGNNMLEIEPDFWGGNYIVGINLMKSQKYANAEIALNLALLQNYSGLTLSACGVLSGMKGEKQKGFDFISKMKDLDKTQPVSNYDLGIVYGVLGDIETACLFFEKAIKNHEPSMLFFKYIVRDWLEDFKDDQRVLQILKKTY